MAVAIPFILAAAAGTMAYSGFKQERALAKGQEAELKSQASAVSAESAQAELSQRREAQRILGESRAAGAQYGLLESGSFRSAYSQSAAEAELDALNIRYQGLQRRRGLLAQASMVRAARPSWAQGLLGTGAAALSAYAGAKGMGGKAPSGGGGGGGGGSGGSGGTGYGRGVN